MLVFESNSRHLWEVFIFCFHLKKTAAGAHWILSSTYGVAALSKRTCREWFQRFKNGDFDAYTERGTGSLVTVWSARHSPWHMNGRLPVSGVEGPSREIPLTLLMAHFQPRIKYRLWRFRRLSAWLEIWHELLACHCPTRGPPNSRNKQPTVHVLRWVARWSRGNQRAPFRVGSAWRWKEEHFRRFSVFGETSSVWCIMSCWNRVKPSQGIGIERNWCVWAEHWRGNGHCTKRGTTKLSFTMTMLRHMSQDRSRHTWKR